MWVDPTINAVSVIQIDEFWHFTKKNGITFGFGWLYVPKKRNVIAFFCGRRHKKSAKTLWVALNKRHPRRVCTDGLPSYKGVIPRRTHKTLKKFTHTIESFNATFRHDLPRFHRKTKCSSKSTAMVFAALLLFVNKSILF